jgi:hypothetical protein
MARARAIDYDRDYAYDRESIVPRVQRGPAYQAYQVLHVGYVGALVVAGGDKFVHLLCNWEKYLAPALAARVSFSAHHVMLAVGVVEVIIGLLVALKPKLGAYVAMIWLFAIIGNLVLLRGYWDVALRDFGLALGALALGRLSQIFDVHAVVKRARMEAAKY